MNWIRVIKDFFSFEIGSKNLDSTSSVIRESKFLKDRGINNKTEISLHFLFLEMNQSKTKEFTKALKCNEDYQMIKIYKEGEDTFLSGRTHKKRFDESSIVTFKKKMETLGARYNFQFLGWGTDV